MSLASPSLQGCYYGHVVSGQLRLLLGRNSLDDVVEDPATPAEVRERLVLVGAARRYAAELGLDVGERYTSYVEWPGDRVVTIVVATRPGEVDAAGFTFPLIGRVPYKGFFEAELARREADRLRREGLDVCLLPVRAYSTLGWFDDPLTTPMLQQSDGRLVETVVHELVHATVFVPSQPEFNEGVARFIGQEASVRFFEAAEPADAEAGDRSAQEAARNRRRVNDDRLVADAVLDFQQRVETLYAEAGDAAERSRARARLEADLRARVATLALAGRDSAALAGTLRLNDACLAARGTYARDRARHERVLRTLGGDLPAFVRRLRESAEREDPRAAFFGPPPQPRAGRGGTAGRRPGPGPR